MVQHHHHHHHYHHFIRNAKDEVRLRQEFTCEVSPVFFVRNVLVVVVLADCLLSVAVIDTCLAYNFRTKQFQHVPPASVELHPSNHPAIHCLACES